MAMKTKVCIDCNMSKHIHGLHRHYAKPFGVVWLYAKHHHRLHATLPEMMEGHALPD
jgi:hypothetical protein